MSAKILLVEDDLSLAATLSENLKLEGYQIQCLNSGQAAIEAFRKPNYDLVVLDNMLPEYTGLEVLTHIRQISQVPVLMISAKGTSADRIKGLELQADDYLPKPFHLKEFLLRVQSLLRRTADSPPQEPGTYKIGKATFSLEGMFVKTEMGQEPLTAKEVGLLRLLITNAEKVVSREQILSAVWQNSEATTTRTIDNIIVKLRKMIEINPSEPEFIISHRGIGYSLHLE